MFVSGVDVDGKVSFFVPGRTEEASPVDPRRVGTT